MPTARFFAPMFARPVSHALVCTAAIAFAVLLFTHARACPMSEPKPLRLLYIRSDRIVTARVGKTETVKVEMVGEEGEEQTPYSYLKTALLVSSTLKGEPEPVVYVNHTMYDDDKDALSSASEGDTLLVFLNRQSEEDGGGFYIEEMGFGLRVVPDAELKVYTKRIEELAAIMQEKKPDEAAIVEWLVRCTEEPATRWDGAYDLWTSYNASRYAQEESASKQENGEAVEATGEITEVPVSFVMPSGYDMQGKFIQLLTPEQKNRLLLALLNIESLNGNDYPLIEIVKDYDDPRLVPYLLSQLRRQTEGGSYPPDDLMTIIAGKLGDKGLSTLAENFQHTDFAEEFPSGDEADEAGEVNSSESEAATEEARQQAIEQSRNAALQYFITLAESVASGAATPDAQLNAAAPDQP